MKRWINVISERRICCIIYLFYTPPADFSHDSLKEKRADGGSLKEVHTMKWLIDLIKERCCWFDDICNPHAVRQLEWVCSARLLEYAAHRWWLEHPKIRLMLFSDVVVFIVYVFLTMLFTFYDFSVTFI